MTKIKPITPRDCEEAVNLPDYVIKGVNELLLAEYRGKEATLKQKDVITSILRYAPEDITRQTLFDKHLLDFEYLYKKQGWNVRYDSPCRDESFEPYYVFKPQ